MPRNSRNQRNTNNTFDYIELDPREEDFLLNWRPSSSKLLILDFIFELLQAQSPFVDWDNHRDGKFIIRNVELMSYVWGVYTGNPTMNIDKFCRALRSKYRSHSLKKFNSVVHGFEFMSREHISSDRIVNREYNPHSRHTRAILRQNIIIPLTEQREYENRVNMEAIQDSNNFGNPIESDNDTHPNPQESQNVQRQIINQEFQLQHREVVLNPEHQNVYQRTQQTVEQRVPTEYHYQPNVQHQFPMEHHGQQNVLYAFPMEHCDQQNVQYTFPMEHCNQQNVQYEFPIEHRDQQNVVHEFPMEYRDQQNVLLEFPIEHCNQRNAQYAFPMEHADQQNIMDEFPPEYNNPHNFEQQDLEFDPGCIDTAERNTFDLMEELCGTKRSSPCSSISLSKDPKRFAVTPPNCEIPTSEVSPIASPPVNIDLSFSENITSDPLFVLSHLLAVKVEPPATIFLRDNEFEDHSEPFPPINVVRPIEGSVRRFRDDHSIFKNLYHCEPESRFIGNQRAKIQATGASFEDQNMERIQTRSNNQIENVPVSGIQEENLSQQILDIQKTPIPQLRPEFQNQESSNYPSNVIPGYIRLQHRPITETPGYQSQRFLNLPRSEILFRMEDRPRNETLPPIITEHPQYRVRQMPRGQSYNLSMYQNQRNPMRHPMANVRGSPHMQVQPQMRYYKDNRYGHPAFYGYPQNPKMNPHYNEEYQRTYIDSSQTLNNPPFSYNSQNRYYRQPPYVSHNPYHPSSIYGPQYPYLPSSIYAPQFPPYPSYIYGPQTIRYHPPNSQSPQYPPSTHNPLGSNQEQYNDSNPQSSTHNQSDSNQEESSRSNPQSEESQRSRSSEHNN